MHYEILDKTRLNILPLLNNFKNVFYLAGGTGLALQLGHRDSIDFDFFTDKEFNSQELYKNVNQIFVGHKIQKIQEETGTLTLFIDDNIKISFFFYPYKLLETPIDEPNLSIASIIDIACMKLSAIVSRATNKDYIDIYFILQKISLKTILQKLPKKMPQFDENLILKSLIYFQDLIIEPIDFKNNSALNFEEVKKSLITQVKALPK